MFLSKGYKTLLRYFTWINKSYTDAMFTRNRYLNTRKNSSRMRTSRLLTVSHSIPCISGVCAQLPPGCRPPSPSCRPSPLDADPPGHVTGMYGGKPPPPAVNRMTHRCKNITLPQTSFAGGNYANRFNKWWKFSEFEMISWKMMGCFTGECHGLIIMCSIANRLLVLMGYVLNI